MTLTYKEQYEATLTRQGDAVQQQLTALRETRRQRFEAEWLNRGGDALVCEVVRNCLQDFAGEAKTEFFFPFAETQSWSGILNAINAGKFEPEAKPTHIDRFDIPFTIFGRGEYLANKYAANKENTCRSVKQFQSFGQLTWYLSEDARDETLPGYDELKNELLRQFRQELAGESLNISIGMIYFAFYKQKKQNFLERVGAPNNSKVLEIKDDTYYPTMIIRLALPSL